MNFPNHKPKSFPTPSNILLICDKCRIAKWTIDVSGLVQYCSCGSRCRKASPTEIVLANRKISK